MPYASPACKTTFFSPLQVSYPFYAAWIRAHCLPLLPDTLQTKSSLLHFLKEASYTLEYSPREWVHTGWYCQWNRIAILRHYYPSNFRTLSVNIAEFTGYESAASLIKGIVIYDSQLCITKIAKTIAEGTHITQSHITLKGM